MFGYSVEFLMVACLFADLVVKKGAAVWTWVSTEFSALEKKL